MVETCWQTLRTAGVGASYVAADIRVLPFPAQSFDLVLANHMLYELDDVAPAVAELARVVRPGVTVVATTYSESVRVHLIEFHRAALAQLGIRRRPESASSFCLENGAAVLGAAFERVQVHTLEEFRTLDPTGLTETYLRSGRYRQVVADERVPTSARDRLATAFRAQAEQAEQAEVREGPFVAGRCGACSWRRTR
jgi:SAM-dependent methyltransferase